MRAVVPVRDGESRCSGSDRSSESKAHVAHPPQQGCACAPVSPKDIAYATWSS